MEPLTLVPMKLNCTVDLCDLGHTTWKALPHNVFRRVVGLVDPHDGTDQH